MGGTSVPDGKYEGCFGVIRLSFLLGFWGEVGQRTWLLGPQPRTVQRQVRCNIRMQEKGWPGWTREVCRLAAGNTDGLFFSYFVEA